MVLRKFAVILFLPMIFFAARDKKTSFVDPFIGTGAHGHTYPGPSLPFGMVQLGPDTGLSGWDHCSGFHYSDDSIIGFTHTHLSGTGCLDYGDILFIPSSGKIVVSPGTKENPDKGYRSRYSHKSEKARPGFYSVLLKDHNIRVELTVTKRAGFHRYIYSDSDNPHIIVDLKHRDKVLDSYIKIVNNREIAGYRISGSWAKKQYVYFVARFSKPFSSNGIYRNGRIGKNIREARGNNLVSYFTFDLSDGNEILVKVGISPVDINGARKNLDKEIPGWDFQKTCKDADEVWERALNKIHIESSDKSKKTIFYTALYHSLLNPNLYIDVDGRFRGRDLEIHSDPGFKYYTLFSLWDTYRATHPLFTIFERERTLDFIKTFIKQYEQGGKLPVWELSSNETNTMIGYHAVSVITDAYIKGIDSFDKKRALDAMVCSGGADDHGLKLYRKDGYIPGDKESESISKTLEYSYDDWCIAQFAKRTGNKSVYNEYIKRAQYYKNIFDPSTGFFRPKINGGWIYPFDPREVNNHFTEANAWQYSFAAVHDIGGQIKLLGSTKKYLKMLDDLFSVSSEMTGREQSDITGLIGQYAHGNEPSHHIAYLYSYAGAPWKTQERVKSIVKNMYKNGPAGICGNEDCGQMSSWYIFSALGFYPVIPGSDQYVLGTPAFKKVCLNLENGNKFIINTIGLSDSKYYVKNVTLNGKSYEKLFIRHKDIMKGGTLIFHMTSSPAKKLIIKNSLLPFSRIDENLITITPYSSRSKISFDKEFILELKSPDKEAEIYHSFGIGKKFSRYKTLLKIDNSSVINFFTKKNGIKSSVITSEYIKMSMDRDIELKTNYSTLYTAGGDKALIDSIRGGKDFRTGKWQGYNGVDLDVIVDLKEEKLLNSVGINFLQDINSWIFMPKYVDISISSDKKKFFRIGRVKSHTSLRKEGSIIEEFKVKNIDKKGRYIKIFGKNIGVCPLWHKGSGGKAMIFTDEILID